MQPTANAKVKCHGFIRFYRAESVCPTNSCTIIHPKHCQEFPNSEIKGLVVAGSLSALRLKDPQFPRDIVGRIGPDASGAAPLQCSSAANVMTTAASSSLSPSLPCPLAPSLPSSLPPSLPPQVRIVCCAFWQARPGLAPGPRHRAVSQWLAWRWPGASYAEVRGREGRGRGGGDEETQRIG